MPKISSYPDSGALQNTDQGIIARGGANFSTLFSTWKSSLKTYFDTLYQAAEGHILIIDQKAQNTAGGTFTSGAWRTRDLNTEVFDTGNNASVAGNQITLDAGTYRCFISAPAVAVNMHMAKLYNVTAGADIAFGTSEYSFATDFTQTRSFIIARFTLAVQSVLEVRHQCNSTYATQGFGYPTNYAVEKYTMAEFWKE